MSEQETEEKNETTSTDASAGETPQEEATPEVPIEKVPSAPEPEICEIKAKGAFANGKGVMTTEDGCMDLGRLQVVMLEQNGKTYEYSRISVR